MTVGTAAIVSGLETLGPNSDGTHVTPAPAANGDTYYGSLTIQLVENGANQDSCEGQTIPLTVIADSGGGTGPPATSTTTTTTPGSAGTTGTTTMFPGGLDGECNEYLVSVEGSGFGVETVVACTMEWPTGVPFDGGAAEISLSTPGQVPFSGANAFGNVTDPGCDALSGSSASFVTVANFNPDVYNGMGTGCESASVVGASMSGNAWFDAALPLMSWSGRMSRACLRCRS